MISTAVLVSRVYLTRATHRWQGECSFQFLLHFNDKLINLEN